MPKFIVSPRIKAIAQDTNMSCWAAALAMLHNWKYPVPRKTPKQLAERGGQLFLEYYELGLPHSANPTNDKFGLLVSTYNLKALPPQTYSLNQWKTLLADHGPLAILADAAQDGDYYTHILVIEGIDWESDFNDAIFHVVDPDGGVAIPTNATELAKRLDAKDVVSLTVMKGWCYP
jgi:Papain-like cysteine protease AvrRpt2